MKKISAFPSLLALTICALGLMTCVVSAQLPGSLTNGLVSYYSFDGNANDSVGTNDATVFGAVLTNGITGVADSAFYFNGISSYMTAGYTPFANNAFSWSLWIRPLLIGAETEILAATSLGWSGRAPGFNLNSSGYINFYSYDDNLSGEDNALINAIQSLGPVQPNIWTHVAITSDTNNLRSLYLNGTLQSHSISSGYGQQINNLLFGIDRFSRPEYSFTGGMDDVMIYDRPLSATEVTDLYNAQAVPEPSTYALLLLSGAASLWALKRRES